ncbi:MAG: ABC transporter substrate-binding protein, partial [Planctomycetota bacterium]
GERVHKALIEAQSTYNDNDRVRLYGDVQEIVFEEAPVVPLVTVPDFRVLRKEVRGYTIFPAGGEFFRTVSFARQ